ncbi:MAG: Ig-like domain-containing protein [Aureliella sp.]
MLNADWNPGAVAERTFFSNAESQAATLAYLNERFGDGGGASAPGEGFSDNIVGAAEVEPNNGLTSATLVPLAGNFGVNISGTGGARDVDWFAVDLEAGAIVDARLIAGQLATSPQIAMYDPTGREIIASAGIPTSPEGSPLTGADPAAVNPTDIALHYVIPTAGRYYYRLGSLSGAYTLQLRQYRPVLEDASFGTKQTLFLDFNGASFPRDLFFDGAPGTVNLSDTRNFLGAYGIQDNDHDAFIDEVVRRSTAKFDYLAANTTNPNFGIEILNSKDHADPWGEANVSRVVIGGTWQQLVGDPTAASSGVLGIAQSVDAGNFITEETAIVMHDTLIATVGLTPIDPFARRVDVIAELMSLVIVHEAGHFFGGRHQDPNNAILSIMDQFYDPIISSGSGDDGIFGTDDDEPVQFRADQFTGLGQFNPDFTGDPNDFPRGWNDVVNWIGWALSTGQVGGSTINGTVFNDLNANRSFDAGDNGFAGVTVYVDANNNAIFDAGEASAVSAADGSYSLSVGAGTHIIREVVPAGFRLTTAGALTITTTADQTVNNANFGNTQVLPDVTGTKWSDTNGNGIRDAGESAIGGVWIYIDEDGDNRIDIGEPSTQTAADGTYKLTFGGPGTYTVREVVDTGFVQTFPGPAFDNEHTITLTGDPAADAAAASGLDFGNRLTVDFGDAPQSYGIASHGFVDGLILGNEWDSEEASQFSTNAQGDDANGVVGGSGDVIDDEDGIVLSRPLVAGSTNNRIAVTAQNTTGENAFLNGWIDFNQNGVFEAAERVITNSPVGTGTTSVTFAAPGNALLGDTVARFRYSTDTTLTATGAVGSGEVEDYILNVTDTLELAIDDRFGVSRNSALNTLDVLANDFRLPGETLEIVSVSGTTAGGIVQVTPSNTVLYTPPNGFIGQDSFNYTMRNSGGDVDTATVIIDVNLFFENPLAIDDSFTTSTNVIDLPLNVLENDIEGQNGALTIISVTQPDKGGQINIATGGKSLRYTPARDFGGTEFFTYTVADASGEQSSAQVTLHTLPGDRDDDDVLIQLVATDLNGNPISAVQQGQDFLVEFRVDDLRFSSANPGTAAGVFAAYSDLLYSRQLVSTIPNTDASSSFAFETSFFNDYLNFQTGDATIPGIIDEFGAFSNRTVMNDADPTLLATITFNARSPGIADFTPDPADNFPFSDTLLFDTPGSAVPVERIRYIGTQLEIVGDGVEFPVAVDDSVPEAIPQNSIRFPVDVLTNDLTGSTNTITIVSSTNGLFGTSQIDTRGTSNPADDRILYTPNGGFNGADQFTYTIQDARGIQSTATVTVRVGDADSDDIVSLRLSVTDVNGQPVDSIEVGNQFQLRGFVQDLRGFGIDRGIFAAYEDVLYNANLVSPVASNTNDPDLGFQVQFGPNYSRVREGDIRTPGVINEIGAVQIENGNQPLGSAEQLLFVVTLTANSTGIANFIADPADISPLHDTLTFEPPEAVTFDRIRYGFDSVNIVSAGGGGGSGEFAYDVNRDEYVSAIDALLIMNKLNRDGSGSAEGDGEGEGLGYKYDVNDDLVISPLDALLVINYLNSDNGASAEGEFSQALSAGSLAESAVGMVGGETGISPTVVEFQVQPKGDIGARMTDTTFGPAPGDYITDSMFDDADDELEDLLSDLAPGINETWKKDRI